jgi:hypothetical protein
VVQLCIELCPFAETDDSPPTHHNPDAKVVDETVEGVAEPTLIPSRLKEQEPHDAGTSQQVIDNTTVTATEEEEAAREQEEEDGEPTWGPEQDQFIADVRELLFGPDSDEDNDDTNPNAPRINSNDDTGTDAEDDEVTVPIFNDSEINTFRYNLRPGKYGFRRSMTVEQVDACVALEAHDDIDGCCRLLEKLSTDKGEQCEALFAGYQRHWAKEEATSHFKR